MNVVDGEMLSITKVSRLHMAAYLCVASNGVPPSISKRVLLRVQCKNIRFNIFNFFLIRIYIAIDFFHKVYKFFLLLFFCWMENAQHTTNTPYTLILQMPLHIPRIWGTMPFTYRVFAHFTMPIKYQPNLDGNNSWTMDIVGSLSECA